MPESFLITWFSHFAQCQVMRTPSGIKWYGKYLALNRVKLGRPSFTPWKALEKSILVEAEFIASWAFKLQPFLNSKLFFPNEQNQEPYFLLWCIVYLKWFILWMDSYMYTDMNWCVYQMTIKLTLNLHATIILFICPCYDSCYKICLSVKIFYNMKQNLKWDF